MRGPSLPLLAMLALVAVPLTAQSSEFGVRGLGLPGRSSSARVLGGGGALGLFDGESSLNPASLSTLSLTTAVFTMANNARTSVNPAGTSTGRDTRFPQVLIGGPIPRSRFVVGVSYSMFTNRDFQLVSTGTASPRGIPIGVTDTLTSRGGIADLRVALGYALSPKLSIGGGIHFLTGSNRMATRRVWDDPDYSSLEEKAELSYQAIGFSAGVLMHPSTRIAFAASVRRDGRMTIQRDSTTIGQVSMPIQFAGGLRLKLSQRMVVAGQAILRDWSRADSGLVANGAIGARDTREVSGGVELYSNVRRPANKPLRLGVRYAELPFRISTEGTPSEFGVSVGTGVRFARDLGGIDLALERVRRKQGVNYSETGWQFTLGISVRPGT
jgi:hypothetical protein